MNKIESKRLETTFARHSVNGNMTVTEFRAAVLELELKTERDKLLILLGEKILKYNYKISEGDKYFNAPFQTYEEGQIIKLLIQQIKDSQ